MIPEPRSILPAVWEVPPEFRRRMGAAAGRQRAMQADGHLLLVLHKPPGPEEAERKGRFFWRKPDGMWSSDDLGSGPNALQRHLTEYADLITKLDHQEDNARTADEYFAILSATAPLHRASRNMHHALQQAREAFPDDRELINARDRAYEIERNAELLYSDARNALEFAMAKRAEEQAASSHQMAVSAHRLNVLAAFFFPIATFSAIFGSNLRHGLEGFDERTGPLAFLVLLAAGLLCGFVLKAVVNAGHRRK